MTEPTKDTIHPSREEEQMTDRVHIVFDGPPGHEAGRFVEVENDQGRSIRFGEWRERPDGYWELVANVARAHLPLSAIAEAERALEPFHNVAAKFLADALPLDKRGVILHVPLGAAQQGRTGADLTIYSGDQLTIADFRRAASALTALRAIPVPQEEKS